MNQLLDSPISHNHLLRALVPARLVAARRLAPGRYRIAAARGLALAAAVRMVDRIHRHAAHVRPDAAPARAPGIQPGRAALRPKACATARMRLPWPTTARMIRPRAPSDRLYPDASRYYES